MCCETASNLLSKLIFLHNKRSELADMIRVACMYVFPYVIMYSFTYIQCIYCFILIPYILNVIYF